MTSNDISIDDLFDPQLTEAQKAALAYGDANPVTLTEEAVLNAARERTGLADFGPDDFRERLNLLLNEWDSDKDLTNLTRRSFNSYGVRYSSNGLLIPDAMKKYPGIQY